MQHLECLNSYNYFSNNVQTFVHFAKRNQCTCRHEAKIRILNAPFMLHSSISKLSLYKK